MSTLVSVGDAAARLGVSVPVLVRTARRLLTARGQPVGARTLLDSEEVAVLRGALGVSPTVEGLTRSEVLVLAAVARSPLGLGSRGAVAGTAGVSVSTAGRSPASLVAKQLVRRDRVRAAEGRPVERSVVI